jgi:hypothetical protein
MKSKIKKILLDTLTSAYDEGNIDNGGIIGGDNAVDQLYDLFVDEVTFVRHLENPKVPYPVEEPKDGFSRFANTSLFPERKSEKPKKASEILYTNPKTGKAQKLFDTLLPTYTVCIRNKNILDGYKGCSVYITVAALNMEDAKDKAMENEEFTKHIKVKEFNRKYLSVYNPTGNYKIGEVIYFEGDERL